MSGTYEGDIIRPLGLVTLYSGYAELEIDSLLESLTSPVRLDDQKLRWPVGKKLTEARRIIDDLDSNDLADLSEKLDEAVALMNATDLEGALALLRLVGVVAEQAEAQAEDRDAAVFERLREIGVQDIDDLRDWAKAEHTREVKRDWVLSGASASSRARARR